MINFSKSQASQNKRKDLIKKYIAIVVSVVTVFCAIFAAGTGVYLKTHAKTLYSSERQMEKNLGLDDGLSDYGENRTVVDDLFGVADKTNFLVVGVGSDELLTDTIMVLSYDSKLNKISVVSIPRDTYVTLSKDKVSAIQKEKRIVPQSGVMKINEINSYGGKKYGMQYLREEIEGILGIKLHYYVKFDIKGFRKVIDTVGGIEFEVPEPGLYYNDPTQNLNINLKGGLQTLNGKDAEGLVRFRAGYASADLKRMEVQQQFLKEFAKQVLNKKTLVDNAAGLTYDFLSYVETDFKVTDAAKYIPLIGKLDPDNIQSTTLPGHAEYINEASYYIYDKDETKEMVLEFFYSKTSEADEENNRENDEEAPASKFIKEYKTPVISYAPKYSAPAQPSVKTPTGSSPENEAEEAPEEEDTGDNEVSDDNTDEAYDLDDASDIDIHIEDEENEIPLEPVLNTESYEADNPTEALEEPIMIEE